MTTLTPPVARPAQRATTALNFPGVLRSEWIKLRSLRSTIWSYVILVVLALGMALLMSLSFISGGGPAAEMGPAGLSSEAQAGLLVQASTFGAFFGQLVVAVLGVLVITGEYSTGMIRSTLAAVPTRLPALAAKAMVLFAVTFVMATISAVGAFFVASAVFADSDITASLLDADVILPILGSALYLGLVALFALGVGTMLRSSAGGIATVVGVLLVLPLVLQMIPAEWVADVLPYVLSTAGVGMFSDTSAAADAPSFWENLLIVLAWVGASIAGATVLLKRRDA
ncbi:ABC transporter permease subunit [Agromyces ramosus]|uniref:ABC-2 type transport system permease protein n=1 Tax=Agromyces ramosus TaxID=33879 RepID=A0ABU0R398_9MICO|nr:ABC transporter permease subunit [Agromyces ramosus]MDQ0892560.1 ABC-2 type transport system permease protein [Agromyces ramosus]